jgi:hypothetical protein
MEVKVLIESLHKNPSLILKKKTAPNKFHVCTKLPVEIWGGKAILDFHVGSHIVAH